MQEMDLPPQLWCAVFRHMPDMVAERCGRASPALAWMMSNDLETRRARYTSEFKKECFWRAAMAGDMDTITWLMVRHRVYVSAAMALAQSRHETPTRPVPQQWLVRLAPYMPAWVVAEAHTFMVIQQ